MKKYLILFLFLPSLIRAQQIIKRGDPTISFEIKKVWKDINYPSMGKENDTFFIVDRIKEGLNSIESVEFSFKEYRNIKRYTLAGLPYKTGFLKCLETDGKSIFISFGYDGKKLVITDELLNKVMEFK
jgi:hypothetical protein